MQVKNWVCVGLLGTTLAVVGSACGEGVTEYIIVPPDAGQGAGGSGGDDSGDAGPDGGEADADGGPSCDIPACVGDCVPFDPLADEGVPVLLWVGANEHDAPPCPGTTPVEHFKGYGEFSAADATCAACSCGPSSGSCELASSIVARASPCNGAEDAPTTPTDAPAAWDGSCSAENAIPAGLTCAPSGTLCAQSITVSALVTVAEECAPEPAEQPDIPAPTWGLFGRACGYLQDGCDAGELCIPSPPDQYMQCLAWRGEHECPADDYTERVTLYEDYSDTRDCAPCSCGPPENSSCNSLVTFYEDGACSAQIGSVGAWSVDTSCVDVTPAGLAIGSKSATAPIYHGGTCAASGGELVGSADPIGPMTFCCLHLPPPHLTGEHPR